MTSVHPNDPKSTPYITDGVYIHPRAINRAKSVHEDPGIKSIDDLLGMSENAPVQVSPAQLEAPDIYGSRPTETPQQILHEVFEGDTLDLTHDADGSLWIGIKRVCEALGLSFQGQHKKISKAREAGESWAVINQKLTTGSDGKSYRMLFLHLDGLPFWLGTIKLAKVSAGKRPKILRYQAECARTLRDRFFGLGESKKVKAAKKEKRMRNPGELSPTQVNERMRQERLEAERQQKLIESLTLTPEVRNAALAQLLPDHIRDIIVAAQAPAPTAPALPPPPPVPALPPPATKPRWFSATEVGSMFGAHRKTIGVVRKALGLDGDIPGLTFIEMEFVSLTHEPQEPMTRYSPRAASLIGHRLVALGKIPDEIYAERCHLHDLPYLDDDAALALCVEITKATSDES